MPKVSVIVANYNNAKFLPQCLDSLIAQSYQDYEVLVFDDCSIDNSRDVILAYSAKDTRIKLIPLSPNKGVAHLRSIALAHCAGEYIAVLDADDFSLPSRLQLQADYLDVHQDVVLVSSYASVIDAEGRVLKPIVTIPTTDDVLRWRLFSGNCFVRSTLMFRRDAAIKAGGYNSAMTCAEDMDIICRLMLQGKLAAIPHILSCWRSHQSSYTQQAMDRIMQGTYQILRSNVQRILQTEIGNNLAQALHSSQPANPHEFVDLLELILRYHAQLCEHESNPQSHRNYHRLCLGSLLKIRKLCRRQAWFFTVRPALRAAIIRLLSTPGYLWFWDTKLRISLRKRLYLLALRYKIHIG